MQVKELKSEGLNYELEVVVGAQDIARHIDERLTEYGKTAKMSGFRPGKVPLAILKQRYGKAVMGEVLEHAVNDSSLKALQDKGLRPALQPKIEVKEFDEGKDLKYTMSVEILPEFKVMDLKGIALEKPVHKVEAKVVDESVEKIAKQNRETKAIETKRASKTGDVLVMDFHGRTKDDNKEHEGMHAHDARLELGSNQFIPGFEDQLIAKKAGDKVAVEVTFPTPYHSKELEGRAAIFDVEIKEIHEPVDVAIDDEFAKRFGLESLKALKDAMEKQLQTEYDTLSRQRVKRQILDLLDDSHEFPVPRGMLDLEFENVMQQVRMERQADVKEGKLEISDEEKEELKAISERRVRLGMILSEVGRQNNIAVTDQELQRAVINEARRYPGQEAQVFEYFRNNRNALEAMKAPVFEDKVVDFILELAAVTDKPVTMEELTAEDDESYLEQRKKKGKGKSSSASSSEEKPKKVAAKK